MNAFDCYNMLFVVMNHVKDAENRYMTRLTVN